MANELRISLDTSVESHRILKCKQNDDRPLVITLFDSGAYDITNCNLLLRCKKPRRFVTRQTFLVLITVTTMAKYSDVAGVMKSTLQMKIP